MVMELSETFSCVGQVPSDLRDGFHQSCVLPSEYNKERDGQVSGGGGH